MIEKYPITTTHKMVLAAENGDLSGFKDLRAIDLEIQGLIDSFNDGIEKMFVEHGPVSLADYVTPDGLERFQTKYANWAGQQINSLTMVSCQHLAFAISENQQQVSAFTFEKWIFRYEDGHQVVTQGSVDGYDIRLINNQWKVDSVTFYAPESNPK